MTDELKSAATSQSAVQRRTVVKAAAWSVPAVALAIGAPMSATSGVQDVGAYTLEGDCGSAGVAGPGFLLTAGSGALPIGTSILVTGSLVTNIGVFTVSGGTASVQELGGTTRLITLSAALSAGSTIAFRTTLSPGTSFRLNALASLPDGYSATGEKSSAAVSSQFALCTAL